MSKNTVWIHGAAGEKTSLLEAAAYAAEFAFPYQDAVENEETLTTAILAGAYAVYDFLKDSPEDEWYASAGVGGVEITGIREDDDTVTLDIRLNLVTLFGATTEYVEGLAI